MRCARVLPTPSLDTLDAYERAGGGRGLDAATRLGPDAVIEHLVAAGLRGRGGAGFPTGQKWATVQAHASEQYPTTVVVNGAEGEPGSFKDRAVLLANPYAVLEGALIAAFALRARDVVVALKGSFTREIDTMRAAVDAVAARGWSAGVTLQVFAGPLEYLYGEETALLEAIDGRPPFPRVAPPYRHGVDEVTDDDRGESATTAMADEHEATGAPPTVVDNVETMANVPGILANGPAWFREVGTTESPGTIVCTVSGAVDHAGVGEYAMGTPLREVLHDLGGGPRPGRRLVAAMSGVANAVVTADRFDVPVSYEGMSAVDSGLGAAGFLVFDDTTDFAAVAHGASRFLAVESCGQCVPCKRDGIAVSEILDRVRRSDADAHDLETLDGLLRTITDSARCSLAQQHQTVVGSITAQFVDHLRAHVSGEREAVETQVTAPIRDLDEGAVTLDSTQAEKQPDWTHDPVDSGTFPAER